MQSVIKGFQNPKDEVREAAEDVAYAVYHNATSSKPDMHKAFESQLCRLKLAPINRIGKALVRDLNEALLANDPSAELLQEFPWTSPRLINHIAKLKEGHITKKTP